MAEVTAIIKTFERPRALQRLLRSIRRWYPGLRILVGDDSFTPSRNPGVPTLRLPPDVGASAGRNALLQRVDTPLVLQLDDDFEFTRQTRIERLADPVATGRFDLVGGDCLRCRRKWFGWLRTKRQPFYGRITRRQAELQLLPGGRAAADGYLVCDIVPQFFVARTDVLRSAGGWDPDLKTEEHEELFVRLQERGARVAYAPDVLTRHWFELPPHYAPYRRRSYRPLAAQKMGVTRWVDMNGRVQTFAPLADGPTADVSAANPAPRGGAGRQEAA